MNQETFEAISPNSSKNLLGAESSDNIPGLSNTLNSEPLLFIDSNLDNIEQLVEGVSREAEIFLLNNQEDGIEQISDILSQYQNISEVHILTHSEAGTLNVGTGNLTVSQLNDYKDLLVEWSSSLTETADILFYGCNLAAGDLGQSFVSQWSQITGADVAASNDLTGSAQKGGDWDLEVKVGKVETPLIFSPDLQAGYNGTFHNGVIHNADGSSTLQASSEALTRVNNHQQWADGVTVSGVNWNGQTVDVLYAGGGFSTPGGRSDRQIDYNAKTKKAEQIRIDFNGMVKNVQVTLGRLSSNEIQGLPETGIWNAYDSTGKTVSSGVLNPTRGATAIGKRNFLFNLDAPAAFSRLEISASAYGNQKNENTFRKNSSDFNLRAVTYARAQSDDSAGSGGMDTMTGSDGSTTRPDPGTILWSSLNSTANQQVLISKGQTVLVDKDTANLAGVIVDGGTLKFAERFTDTNNNGGLDFTADWILVRNGGRLEIGTEANPYEANATITLDGANEDVMNMGMGGRFLMAMMDGVIDMHGSLGDDPGELPWTQLSANAKAGDTTIQLAEAVSWEAGDEIAIAPSGFEAEETEERTVVSVSGNGRVVTLDEKLEFDHWGQIEIVEGKVLDMRAEVGLLSRNIKIQSPENSVNDEFGFHTMFMEGTSVRLSSIELDRGGQVGTGGRYPIHWHLAKDSSDDYIKNSSIHNSFQRAIVMHSTNNVTVDSNVAYDIFGHAFVFSEEGTEWNNTFSHNLGMLIKTRTNREEFSFFDSNVQGDSTQSEFRSAVFWGKNYYNNLVGNHAAGTLNGNGFHFDLEGVSYDIKQSIVQPSDPINFRENVAHTNQLNDTRLNNYGPRTRGHGLLLEQFGTNDGSDIVFEDFTTYKNYNGGAWLENQRHVLRNSVIADSSTGVFIRKATVKDTVITQKSSNTVGGVLGRTRPVLNSTGTGGGIHIHLSPFTARPTIQNVTFLDIEQAGITVHRDAVLVEGGTVSGLKFVNTDRLYWITDTKEPGTNAGQFIDLDGSLTGTGPSIISGPSVPNDPKYFSDQFNAYVIPL